MRAMRGAHQGDGVTGQKEEKKEKEGEEKEEKKEEKENCCGTGRAGIEGSTRGPREPKNATRILHSEPLA